MLNKHTKGKGFEVLYQDERRCNQHSRNGDRQKTVQSERPPYWGDLRASGMYRVGRLKTNLIDKLEEGVRDFFFNPFGYKQVYD